MIILAVTYKTSLSINPTIWKQVIVYMYKGYIAGLVFCTVRLMGLPVLFRRPNRGRRKIVVGLSKHLLQSVTL